MNKNIKIYNTFSNGWDKIFMENAINAGYQSQFHCIKKQYLSNEIIKQYNIKLLDGDSYSKRDKNMIIELKNKKTLMIAFVRKDYNKHLTGANTLQCVGFFKNNDHKRKNINKYYQHGFDKDVYLISEDTDICNIDETSQLHVDNINELLKNNEYNCILTSGPTQTWINDLANKISNKLFN